jgi:hypothetical protein
MTDIRVLPQPWLWRPRTKPIKIIEIHATRGDCPPELQKGAALNNVQSPKNKQGDPPWGGSFSYVIGADGSMGVVLNDNQMPTYSAGYGGPGSTYAIDEYGISYELAQSAKKEPFTDACLRRAAKEIAAKCKKHGIPAVFRTIPLQVGDPPPGLVRHDRCQNGIVLGKDDPGVQFNEARFLALMQEEDDMEFSDVTSGMATIRQKIEAGGMGSLSIDERKFYNEVKWYAERFAPASTGGAPPALQVTIPRATINVPSVTVDVVPREA